MSPRSDLIRRSPRSAGAAVLRRVYTPVGLGMVVAALATALVGTLIYVGGRDVHQSAAAPDVSYDVEAVVASVVATDAGAPAASLSLLQAAVASGSSEVASLPTALETYATARADVAAGVLNDFADAETSTEQALYSAVQAMLAAAPDDLAASVAAVAVAEDAVRASALAFRAELVASTAATFTQPAGTDVSAQLAYLLPHAYAYNSAEWGDYNPYGGDCVNFTSQGLLARGWVMDEDWYSGGEMFSASGAWISTPKIEAYFAQLGLPYSTEADLDRVRVGDVGIFSWGGGEGDDHTMTVSRVDYTEAGPVISFVSHNSDGTARDLTTTITTQHPGSSVRIYHLP